MCSVVTNMVTSLEFQPIRCATMLFHYGRTRNVYVATRIILFSSTAESSATSGYIVATERSGQSEEWASRNVKRNKPSLFPTVVLIDVACNHEFSSIINFIFPYFKLSFHCIPVTFPCMEISLIFCLCFHLLCRRGNNHFDVHFRRIGPVLFSVERWKRCGPWRKKWMERCLFPARVGISPLINNMIKVLFPICTLIWCVSNYVSRQGMV